MRERGRERCGKVEEQGGREEEKDEERKGYREKEILENT